MSIKSTIVAATKKFQMLGQVLTCPKKVVRQLFLKIFVYIECHIEFFSPHPGGLPYLLNMTPYSSHSTAPSAHMASSTTELSI